MGFLGSVLGSDSGNSGGAGLNYKADNVRIDDGATVAQANQAYSDTQSALAQQQAFMQALQAQNGVQNQSNIYNQLGQMAQGQGPNPAQAQLANATGANTANQAALMASQRGAGSNVGLMSRQAAMQGAANQQNSIGQAAALQAQQSQNAINAQAGIAGQQVGNLAGATTGYNQAAQSEQQNLLNSINQQNNARAGIGANMNTSNAGVSQVAAKAQSDFFGGIMSGIAPAVAMSDKNVKENIKPADPKDFMESIKGYNYDYKDPSMGQGKQMGVMAQDVEKSAPQLVIDTPAGKAIDYNKAGGPILASLANINERLEQIEGSKDKKSEAKKQKFADGGMAEDPQMTTVSALTPPSNMPVANSGYGGSSKTGSFLFSSAPSQTDGGLSGAGAKDPFAKDSNLDPMQQGSKDLGTGAAKGLGKLFGGGSSDAGASSGVAEMLPATGGAADIAMVAAAKGGVIPGKAKVKGNSYANDTVDAKLSPGEVVIPRSVMQSKNPSKEAARFVAAVLAKQSLKGKR